jgi:hypothetical protein
MMIIRAAVGALLLVAIVPRNAAADREGRHEGMSVQLLGNLGLALPGGDIGVEAELFLHPRFSLGLGAGLALGGAQLATTARFRPVRIQVPIFGGRRIGELSGGIGIGHSMGDYEHWTLLAGDATFDDASWINAEAFVEFRSDAGPTVRGVVGGSWMIDSTECSSQDSDLCRELTEGSVDLPYVGVALGWTL